MKTLNLTESERILLNNKFEYKFKKSAHEFIEKFKNSEKLTIEDAEFLIKKLEYKFKNSEHELVNKIKNFINENKK